MWQTACMYRVYIQVGLYSEVQQPLSFYRVTCERKRPITVVTKGGRGVVFHCTGDLMDCTITTAHSSMDNLLQLQSIKTQTETMLLCPTNKLIENGFKRQNPLGLHLVKVSRPVPNNTGSLVNFHII